MPAFAATHCAYTGRDGQAELNSVVGNVAYRDGLPACRRSPIQVLTVSMTSDLEFTTTTTTTGDLGVRLRTDGHIQVQADVSITSGVERGGGAGGVQVELRRRQNQIRSAVETRLESMSTARHVHLRYSCMPSPHNNRTTTATLWRRGLKKSKRDRNLQFSDRH